MRIDIIKNEANDILEKRKAECSCIEYKASEFQLDKILKTICAYGNNYYENEHSFIFVGVEEQNSEKEKSIPSVPIKGIEEGRLEIAKNTLNSLRPYIYPNVKFDIVTNEFKGKKYLLIVVGKQTGGPFNVTDRALKDKKIGLKPGRYVRIESDTRLATVSEEYALLRKFAQYHFTSEMNEEATLDDLELDYLREYLSITSQQSIQTNMTKEKIAEAMNLFEKNESLSKRVKNFAVLMFANRPDRIIPYSTIEIIANTFGNAERMEAKSFSGPIWKQYYAALNYITENFIRTITVREDGIATNRKVSNFPFKAVEELLANAIVHKNYENEKSIQIYITDSEINIINYNDPLPPITVHDMNNMSFFHERDSINPEIRDMFKSLGIIESYGTGIGEAKKACGENTKDVMFYKEFPEGTDITSVVIPCNSEYRTLVGKMSQERNKDPQNDNRRLQIKELVSQSKFSSKTKNNIDKIVLDNLNNLFGPKEIILLLDCSPNTATKYIKILLQLNLIEEITGAGKSKYKFK